MISATYLFESEMSSARGQSLGLGMAVAYSHAKPGAERPNEDAAALLELDVEHSLLIVADGAGGLPGGARASRVAIERLSATVEDAIREGAETRSAILEGIENANRAVLELANGSGTTLAIAEIANGEVRPYHVGDSQILLTGQRGKLKFATISHSPTGYAMEAGMLGEEEALVHEDRHYVSNLLGSADMRIEMGASVRIGGKDTLVLASDGLSDNLLTDEVVDCVRKGPLLQAATRMAKLCGERMSAEGKGPSKPDDLTFLLFRLQP